MKETLIEKLHELVQAEDIMSVREAIREIRNDWKAESAKERQLQLEAYKAIPEVEGEEKAEFVAGARALGAAFQKVNFLRDLSADFDKLGRSYFPLIKVEDFNNSERDRLVADIRNDLNTSKVALNKLPSSSKRAVGAALMFFDALNNKIAATPANELIQKRIRVNNAQKIFILLKATFGVSPK